MQYIFQVLILGIKSSESLSFPRFKTERVFGERAHKLSFFEYADLSIHLSILRFHRFSTSRTNLLISSAVKDWCNKHATNKVQCEKEFLFPVIFAIIIKNCDCAIGPGSNVVV